MSRVMSAPRATAPIGEAERLASLPAYPFHALELRAEQIRRGGGRPLAFHLGDPDLPAPRAVRDAAALAVQDPRNARYSSSRGEPELRSAIAAWMERRFGVAVDPEREVVVLLGSKEGLEALPAALLNPGDLAAVPDPGYPAYLAAVALAGARAVRLPLDPEAGWSPKWGSIAGSTRLAYLNYPNNPTGAVADRAMLREAVEQVADRGAVLAYDNAYSEVTYRGAPAPSLLEIPGGREVGVEFHSFSKTFGLPGWRLGFAVGAPPLIAALTKLKSQRDSGAALPLQQAAITALELYRGRTPPPEVRTSVREYGRRLERLAEGLRAWGAEVEPPQGGLYLWQPTRSTDGTALAERLLDRASVLVTPGAAFGPGGARYVRWSATRPMADVEEALRRLAGAGFGP